MGARGRSWTRWRIGAALVAWFVALVVSGVADAHEGATLKAALELRDDGTFVLDAVADREHLPEGFGADAAVAVDDAPADPDLARLARGVAASVAVAFDGVAAPARAAWRAPRRPLDVHLRLTGDAPRGARSVALRNALPSGDWVVSVRRPGAADAVTEFVAEGVAMRPVEFDAPDRGLAATAAEFLVQGFLHIVPLGADHILFVLGLFLCATRGKALLLQVTAFTVAHTASLALSVCGVVSLPPVVVEPLIAASIVFVALENLVLREVGRARLVVVFVFGLLHGLGFAGALSDLGLPEAGRATALVSFNVGVEAGQLAVLAPAWFLVARPFRDRPWYRARVVVPCSLAIAAMAAWWAVTRVLDAV